jgi:hypothetical protein
MKKLKLAYYCFMLRLYRLLKIKPKTIAYFAKVFVLAADMKIIGNRDNIVSEYDM